MSAKELNPSAPWRAWIAWAAIFLVALGLRLTAVFQYEAHHPHANAPVIDEASYERWGLEIAGGEWIGTQVFFQEPLYPYWLGGLFTLFGHDLFALRIVQAFFGALTAVLVGRLARALFGAAAGWFAGAACALHRAAILLPCLLLKANLFLPLLALLAIALVRPGSGRPRRWLAIGLLAGLGALLRGNMLVLTPLLVLAPVAHAWLARGGFRAALPRSAAALGGIAMVLLPVAFRNQAVGGVFALTTSGAGTNLYGGNNEHNMHGVATEFPWVRGIPEHEAGDWRREAERRAGRALDPGEVSSFWSAELWESVRARPAMHGRILLNKLRLTLGDYEVPDNHDLDWDARYVPILRLRLPGFDVTGALGLAGIAVFLLFALFEGRFRRALTDGDRGGLDLALLFFAYLATIVLTVTSMRARLPLIVLLAPFAGSWCAGLLAASRSPGRFGALTIAAGLSMLVTLNPVLDAEAAERARLGRDHNLAVQLLREDDGLAEAAEIARRLIARDTHNPRFATLLSDIEWREGGERRRAGDEEAGRELVRSALARLEAVVTEGLANPRERARAYRLAGWIQLDLDSVSIAERHFRRAREFAGDDPDFMFDHLQALVFAIEREPDGPRRDARVGEAVAMIESLRGSEIDPRALDDFASRLGP